MPLSTQLSADCRSASPSSKQAFLSNVPVRFHRLWAGLKHRSDIACATAAANQLKHLKLAVGKSVQLVPGERGSRKEIMQQPRAHLPAHKDVAALTPCKPFATNFS